jgi:lycopene beta-cyclase
MQQQADVPAFSVGITGSGASALSLAYHLRNIPSVDSIRIVAPEPHAADDKTWCFWDADAVLNEDILHHSWNKLCVYTPDGTVFQQQMNQHRYLCIRSTRYQEYLLNELKSDRKISIISESVELIDTPSDLEGTGRMGARIVTDNDEYFSDIVFQSHLRANDKITYASDRIALRQHFLGWDIRCNQDVFEPETAILMDFRVPQDKGFAFVYVLPFDKRSALVELTYFTPELFTAEHYKETLLAYLCGSWNCQLNTDSIFVESENGGDISLPPVTSTDKVYFEVEREEFGVIPMTDTIVKSADEYPVYSIGMAGGHAKASTGYTFSRIQKDSRRIAEALKISSLPDRSSLSAPRFRFYDLLILNIIRNNPEKAVLIFTELFRKNGFDGMLSFLDEKTSFIEELKIMASVPSYMDFFRSMWQTRHRFRDVLKHS